MLVGLASFVCFIIVLIKQFKTAGVVHGIIGIITCGIWTLIWGWMNANNLGIRNIMLIWTLLFVLYWILIITTGGFAFSYGMNPTGVTP
ncbi:MAG TPA: hypothetical protein VN282_02940 [Pyrinomonadaceae bacterium]|nr:hypothetical protein [Pyrinomonadaceae bacterium]